jgi:hypothetical protein
MLPREFDTLAPEMNANEWFIGCKLEVAFDICFVDLPISESDLK